MKNNFKKLPYLLFFCNFLHNYVKKLAAAMIGVTLESFSASDNHCAIVDIFLDEFSTCDTARKIAVPTHKLMVAMLNLDKANTLHIFSQQLPLL